ncbi:hypothetical protein FDENT_11095 [Fusarium denticulatum]|uniref:Uncharacterized protein n=1 Tax=Fusarium denticulatum TaxID=48507 RepID=A0A8H5WTZ7_9HYPO|nr:hypothetical protein FDENT_11095 [Fusarium denticulatum]
MVFIEPHGDVPCLTAYLAIPLTEVELAKVKAEFELGACSQFNPLLELKIVPAPDVYIGKSHQYMRAKEDEADRNDAFVVIDEDYIERHAICILEDLDYAGVEKPLKNDFWQPEVSDNGGFDMREQQWDQVVEVTAEPGEFPSSRISRRSPKY